MIKLKKFIFILILTFGITTIPTIFIDFNTSNLIKPLLFPPKILFPIVWSILYVLMSISLYLSTKKDNQVFLIYIIQLILNSLWSPLFFSLKAYLLSAIELIFLLIIVIIMIYQMKIKNKISFYFQIPYVIWLLFALYLNISILVLN